MSAPRIRTVKVSLKSPRSGGESRSSSEDAKATADDKKKQRRPLRLRTYIGAVVMFIVVFVIAALASDYIVGTLNSSMRKTNPASEAQSSRTARGRPVAASADNGDGDGEKVVDPTLEKVEIVQPGLGDAILPGAMAGEIPGPEIADPYSDSEEDSSDLPSASSSGSASETDPEEFCTTEKCDAAEQHENTAPRPSLFGVDVGSGVDQWRKEGSLDILEEKIGVKFPEHHRSLNNADVSKCPFARGHFKSRETIYLIDVNTEAYKNRVHPDNLTAVDSLVEERVQPSVPRIPLRSGHEMPVLGLGTHNVATRHGVAIMKSALSLGYRMFDTGFALEFYSQEALGIALSEQELDRSELFISVKIDSRHYTPLRFRHAVMESMRLLNIDYIDLLLLKDPYCGKNCRLVKREDQGSWQDAWREMEEMKRQGVARDLGVAAFGLHEVTEIMEMSNGVGLSVVQGFFDPFHQERELRAFCQRNGIIFQGFSTMGKAWLYADDTLSDNNPVQSNEVIANVAQRHSSTSPQTILAWALDSNVSVIPGTMNLVHLKENLAALDLSLDDSAMDAINGLDGIMETRFYTMLADHQSEATRDRIRGTKASLKLKKKTLAASKKGMLAQSSVTRKLERGDRAVLVPVSCPAKATPQYGHLLALDPTTGEERWSVEVGGPIFAAPTVSADGSTVYLATGDWRVYSLSAIDGTVQWVFEGNHSVAAPVLEDTRGRVYVADMSGTVHVLSADSGAEVASQTYGQEGILHMAMHSPHNMLYVNTLEMYEQNFVAVNYATGKVEYETDLFGAASRAPIVSNDGKLVFSSGAGFVDESSRVVAINIEKRKKIWSRTIGILDEHAATLALSADNKVLYALHPSGLFTWYNATKGRTIGEVYIGEGVTMATPIPLNSTMVLVASGDGWLYLVCTRRARYFEFLNLKQPIIETPLLFGPKLYVVSRFGHLWRIDLNSRSIDWQKTFDKKKFNAPVTVY
ncbi:uncharacterized protein LOC135829801 [Sycon ciliatum]|uniref:uncharacterized protein LOC135829801 n=1 Tax=Sycon ciliatum TaxID=27933 RepID=UPI0031F67D9C